MSKYSYLIFQVGVAIRRRPDQKIPLEDIDGNRSDLLALVLDGLNKAKGSVVQDDRSERAHRIEEFLTDGRTILIEGKVGPFGSFGTSVDLDTGNERDFTDRTANMFPLRSMMAIPREGYDALLICERAASSHFRNPIEKTIFRPINSDLGITIKTRPHIDPEAWSRFLDDANVQKVTAVYRSKRTEDLGAQRGRAQDLKIVAGGVVARRLGRKLSALISNVGIHDQPIAYNLDDYPDLRPGDRDNYEQDHLEIQVGDGAEQRTIVIEQTQLPQFAYPLQRRLDRRILWDTWKQHAHGILSDLGVSMDP